MNISSDFVIITAIAIFVILVLVFYKSICEIPSFKGPIAFILAVCSALLCLIGMADLLGVRTAEDPSGTANHIIDIRLDFILLPYATLALTILLSLLVLMLMRIHRMIRTKQAGLKDIMNASIAISNNQKLITRNIKHFRRIKGLEIEP